MNSSIKVLQPSGILNATSGNQLRHDINDIVLSEKNVIILIDLKNVNFADSSGLGTLVSAMQIIKSSGNQLFICSVNDQVRILFELTRMNNVFKIFTNQEEFNNQMFLNEIQENI
jgi:anti-sigma B factor antagonist